MIDSTTAARLADRHRATNGFLPFILTLAVIAHGAGDCWEPASKLALKRALRRPKDESILGDKSLEAVVRHAVAMHLLSPESTTEKLTLAGAR